MKNVLKGIVFISALLLINACSTSTSDIEISQKKSDKANLKGYKTYTILASSGIYKQDKKSKNSSSLETENEINVLINDELKKKGKEEVKKNPDFFVAYAAGTDREAVKVKLGKSGKESVEEMPKAAIVLMLVDAKSGATLWVSTAKGDVKALPENEKKKRIHFAIKKMLKGM